MYKTVYERVAMLRSGPIKLEETVIKEDFREQNFDEVAPLPFQGEENNQGSITERVQATLGATMDQLTGQGSLHPSKYEGGNLITST